ncbi:hypothetical protein [Methanogenium cariaci]|uniref:hypothetical protein n=1 Tax=Methanogenium cariaci TaxID=2197 RepID=UPI001FE0DF1B|nr:hypothetical protein [Methanogenium cariaci]
MNTPASLREAYRVCDRLHGDTLRHRGCGHRRLGFAGYFTGVVTGAPPVLPVAVCLLALLSLILLTGIKQSAVFAIIFTLIEAGGLIGIIIIGLPHIGSVDYFAAPEGFPGVAAAAALIFFAYQGV